MDTIVQSSYRACEDIAKKRARNFYYAFKVLPRAKRQAICAMYAFMRYCDDISDTDNPGFSKKDALSSWRSALTNTMSGEYANSPILPAFHDTVRRFSIPEVYFHELIDGAEMDLSTNRYATFDDLYGYCYRVASTVGLVCIHIFGFREEIAKQYAEYNGIAFQLTNILRDVKEDAERNRIYIPQADLESSGYTEAELLRGEMNDRFRDLMRLEVKRARDFYDRASPLMELVDAASRPGLAAMTGIYSALLYRIEDTEYDVFSQRVKLSTKEKLAIAARSVFAARSGEKEPTP